MKPTEIVKAATKAISAADSLQSLEELRVKYLGRSGELTLVLRGLGKLPAAQRAQAGEAANRARASLTQAVDERQQELEQAELAKQQGSTTVDLSAFTEEFPGKDPGFQLRHS